MTALPGVPEVESCDDCGYVWDEVSREAIILRVPDGCQAIVSLLEAEPVRSVVRPSPERWSMLEYAAHVRDVMLSVRDRLVVGIVEDDPGFKPMYREERVDLGLYSADSAAEVAREVDAAGAMLGRLFAAIDPALLGRTVQYGFPDPIQRTLLWMGQQVVHEVEHHLGDIEQDLRLLSA